MSTTVLKATGWAIVVAALFSFSARSTPTCNGKKPSTPVDCTTPDPCDGAPPCAAYGTYPRQVSLNCDDGVESDHCVNLSAQPASNPCPGQWICADKIACKENTTGTTCIQGMHTGQYACTNTPLKGTRSCTVPDP